MNSSLIEVMVKKGYTVQLEAKTEIKGRKAELYTFVTHSTAFSEMPVFFTSAISSGTIVSLKTTSNLGRVVAIVKLLGNLMVFLTGSRIW